MSKFYAEDADDPFDSLTQDEQDEYFAERAFEDFLCAPLSREAFEASCGFFELGTLKIDPELFEVQRILTDWGYNEPAPNRHNRRNFAVESYVEVSPGECLPVLRPEDRVD